MAAAGLAGRFAADFVVAAAVAVAICSELVPLGAPSRRATFRLVPWNRGFGIDSTVPGPVAGWPGFPGNPWPPGVVAGSLGQAIPAIFSRLRNRYVQTRPSRKILKYKSTFKFCHEIFE